ncbi:hypothetical protein [uncultured Bdellovibrio sp.]|uniref:hypothetical protein n=1 Tax=Bdellovibrio sp. HCB-162 TaxID=3394234 RepID=UPI0025D7CDE6|nr:hypothetical protein [uncultured Bdellovibrio sp.]
MEKIIQTTVVVITLLLTLQATCFAADFQYVVPFKEVGLDQLSTEVVYHDRLQTKTDSKEIQVVWKDKLHKLFKPCHLSSRLAYENTEEAWQKQMKLSTEVVWAF